MKDIRQRLENGFELLALVIWRFRWVFLSAMVSIALALGSGVTKLEFDTSNEAFLHENDPVLVRYNTFKQQFGRDDVIILSIKPERLFSGPSLVNLKALHSDLIKNVPHLNNLSSMVNARNIRGEEGVLFVEDLLRELPRTADEFGELKNRVLANPLYVNSLVDITGRVTTMIIELDAFKGRLNGEGQRTNLALSPEQMLKAMNAIKEIIARYRSPKFQISMAGMGAVLEEVKGALKSDMMLFLRIAVFAIGFCLLLIFRRITGVVFPLLIVAMALISTLGLMGYVGIPLTIPMVILPSFLLAVGVGAAVHVLAIFYQYLDRGHDRQEATRDALGHSGLAIFMTSLTTAAGLLSFGGAKLAPVAQLGIFAGIGVMFSLLFTIFLLPALLAIFPIKFRDARTDPGEAIFEQFLGAVAQFSSQRPIATVIVTLVMISASLVCAAQLRFSHDILNWLPSDWQVREATRSIDQDIKGTVAVEVLVDTNRENGLYDRNILLALDEISTELLENKIAGVPVGKVTSVVDVLKAVHRALNEHRKAFYAIPAEASIITQQFLLLENSESDYLEKLVDSQFQIARISIRVPWYDTLEYLPLIKEVEKGFKTRLGNDVSIIVTGTMSLLTRTLNAAIRSAAESYIIALVVITTLMAILIGNIRIGIIAMLPNLGPIAVAMGLMWVFSIPLNLFTMLVGSIAIGLAVDDTIHFLHNFRRYYLETGDVQGSVTRTLHTTGRAMLVTSIVLAIGFYIFSLASLNNIVDFGILTGTAIILALVSNFVLAPALMAIVYKNSGTP